MKIFVRNAVHHVAGRLPVLRSIYAENATLRHALTGIDPLRASLLADAGKKRQIAAGLPDDFDIIVPVYNSYPWLGCLLDAYEAMRLHPLFIVDQKSNDASFDLLQRRQARVIVVPAGQEPSVESLLFPIITTLKARYILRLDDDELPAPALLDWIRAHFNQLTEPAIALPRRWVAAAPAGAWRMTSGIEGDGLLGADYQYRLFAPQRVKPVPHLHSPGFELQGFQTAPSPAAIYHFDWIVRSYQRRQAKLAAYDAIQPGLGKLTRQYSLPEDRQFEGYGMQPLQDPAMTKVCDAVGRSNQPEARLESRL